MPLNTPIRNGHYLGPPRTVQPISKIDWRLLLPKNENLYLHHLALLSTDQAADVLQKLLKEFQESQSWLVNAVPFLIPVIYTTTIDSVPIEDVSQSLPCMVDTDSQKRSHVLTNALHNIKTHPSTADFITSYGRFAVVAEAPGTVRARDALLMKLELNQVILLAFVTSSIIGSIVVGVVVGICRHSLDSGFGVGGGVLGVIGVIEGFLTWWLK